MYDGISTRQKAGICGACLGLLAAGGVATAAEPVPANRPAAVRLAASPERVAALQDIVSNLDHSIDILGQEIPDAHGNRHQALTQVTKARDAVQREIDEISGHGRAKDRDTKANHERDAEYRKKMPKEALPGLQTVQLYLQHAEDHLSKDRGEKEQHRKNALTFIRNAQKAVNREIEDLQHRRR